MKYQFNILPEEYRVEAHSRLWLYLIVILILIALFIIGRDTVKKETAYTEINKLISVKNQELNNIYQRINIEKPDENEIQTLQEEIEFVNNNLKTLGTDVVEFLYSLEKTVPDNIVLTDINPKKLNNLSVPFFIEGEAENIQSIHEFVSRLNKSGKYKAQLKSNNSSVVSNNLVQNFVLELEYRK